MNGLKSFVTEVSHSIELPCPFTLDMLEGHSKVPSWKAKISFTIQCCQIFVLLRLLSL